MTIKNVLQILCKSIEDQKIDLLEQSLTNIDNMLDDIVLGSSLAKELNSQSRYHMFDISLNYLDILSELVNKKLHDQIKIDLNKIAQKIVNKTKPLVTRGEWNKTRITIYEAIKAKIEYSLIDPDYIWIGFEIYDMHNTSNSDITEEEVREYVNKYPQSCENNLLAYLYKDAEVAYQNYIVNADKLASKLKTVISHNQEIESLYALVRANRLTEDEAAFAFDAYYSPRYLGPTIEPINKYLIDYLFKNPNVTKKLTKLNNKGITPYLRHCYLNNKKKPKIAQIKDNWHPMDNLEDDYIRFLYKNIDYLLKRKAKHELIDLIMSRMGDLGEITVKTDEDILRAISTTNDPSLINSLPKMTKLFIRYDTINKNMADYIKKNYTFKEALAAFDDIPSAIDDKEILTKAIISLASADEINEIANNRRLFWDMCYYLPTWCFSKFKNNNGELDRDKLKKFLGVKYLQNEDAQTKVRIITEKVKNSLNSLDFMMG